MLHNRNMSTPNIATAEQIKQIAARHPSPNMTTSQRLHLRASLLELARLIFGTLLIAAAVASLPFLFAIL